MLRTVQEHDYNEPRLTFSRVFVAELEDALRASSNVGESQDTKELSFLLQALEVETFEEAMAQIEADIRLSLEAARIIKEAAGEPENVWPSARERAFFIALRQFISLDESCREACRKIECERAGKCLKPQPGDQ